MLNATQVKVIVTYPTADEPAEGDFSSDTALSTVKTFAMNQFGLSGEQANFFLYQGGTKLDLGSSIGTLLQGHEKTLSLRLVKDLIAG